MNGCHELSSLESKRVCCGGELPPWFTFLSKGRAVDGCAAGKSMGNSAGIAQVEIGGVFTSSIPTTTQKSAACATI
jgi:hypothetical protein